MEKVSQKQLSAILDKCCHLAEQAGEKIIEVYNNKDLFFNVEYKADNSPLTIADKISNEIIVKGLRENYPDFAILSEEEKDNKERLKNDYCFIVDPLDGTKEFIKRNGQFTVNIALSYKHKSILAAIYVPAKNELYYAAKGLGAFFKDSSGNEKKIHVSEITDINEVRLVMSSSHGCEEMDKLIEKYNLNKFVKMGSSLKGCLVAKGEAEIYYRYNPTMEWDTAAMQCIAEEAGAIFKQMDDSEMLYNRENSLNDKGFYVINNIQNRMR